MQDIGAKCSIFLSKNFLILPRANTSIYFTLILQSFMQGLNKKMLAIGLIVICLGVVLMGAIHENRNPNKVSASSPVKSTSEESNLVFDEKTIFLSNQKADGTDKKFADILTELKGKVVYIDFWASWCGPCRGEMPYSKKLHETYKGKNVAFLFISFDYTEAAWKKGISKMELAGYHFYPNEAQQQEIGHLYNVEGIPRYMLADRNGKIVNAVAPRPSSGNAITEQINKLLK